VTEGVGIPLVPCNGRLGEIIRGGSVGRYENVGRGTGVCSTVDIEDWGSGVGCCGSIILSSRCWGAGL